MAENDKKDKIIKLMAQSPFLNNDTLKSAYLMGMLAAGLINWQYAINGSDSFVRWLDTFGTISQDRLERLWQKEEEMVRKLTSTAGHGSATINTILDTVVEYAPKAFIDDAVVKSAYVSLAFAMGGHDFRKYITQE